MGGGKFENGAMTAAYGYMFNQVFSLVVRSGLPVLMVAAGQQWDNIKTGWNAVVSGLNVMMSEGADTPANTPDPASGSDPDREDLTKAGRAQQKHGDRVGSAFDPAKGTPQDKNAQGQSTVDSIVNSPDRVDKPNRHGGIDVLQGPGQRGARFGPDGKFTGFLEP